MAEIYTRKGSPFYQCRFSSPTGIIRLSTGVRVGTGKDTRGLAQAQIEADRLEQEHLTDATAKNTPGGIPISLAHRGFAEEAKLRDNTLTRYEVSYKNLRAKFGDPLLNSFTRQRIEEFVQKRRLDHNPRTGKLITEATILRDLTYLSALCEWVATHEPAFENPVRKISKKHLRLKETKESGRWATEGQFEWVLSHVRYMPYRFVLIAAVELGLRKQEILNLDERKHVDLQARRLVLANVDRGETKTGRSRVVYLTDRAFSTLLSTLEARDAILKRHAAPPTTKVLVRPLSGLPLTTIDYWWWSLRNRLSREAPWLVGFRFHHWRHTHASWAAQRSVDEQTTQRNLGHTTASMTRRYRHLSDEVLRSGAEAFSRGGKRSD